MKKAIVTGSTGLIGKSVVRQLKSSGVDVLAIGRKDLEPSRIENMLGTGGTYINLPMEAILSLKECIDSIGWHPGENCVFFNFAWGGQKKLTDGSLELQLQNAIQAAEAVQAAKSIGCTKFVNAGTIEETFAEQWLAGDQDQPYLSTQENYAIAKLAARDLCKIVAYAQKIAYIHTRLSVPLSRDLSSGSYVASTLKKICDGGSYEKPVNKQLFDIILTDDAAKAFHLLGRHGKNKEDYFIGTSKPATLQQFFEYFENVKNGGDPMSLPISTASDAAMFDTSKLNLHTGFRPALHLMDIARYPAK